MAHQLVFMIPGRALRPLLTHLGGTLSTRLGGVCGHGQSCGADVSLGVVDAEYVHGHKHIPRDDRRFIDEHALDVVRDPILMKEA
eukprot:46942-Eustigmatos_ZCMA.PRE.1